jgi:hypothetical protein
MNTANLQMEGLLLALGSLLRSLKAKGLLSEAEIEAMLREAARRGEEDPGRPGQLSAANVEAMLFPVRFLQEDLRSGEPADPYSTIAARVGRSKQRG